MAAIDYDPRRVGHLGKCHPDFLSLPNSHNGRATFAISGQSREDQFTKAAQLSSRTTRPTHNQRHENTKNLRPNETKTKRTNVCSAKECRTPSPQGSFQKENFPSTSTSQPCHSTDTDRSARSFSRTRQQKSNESFDETDGCAFYTKPLASLGKKQSSPKRQTDQPNSLPNPQTASGQLRPEILKIGEEDISGTSSDSGFHEDSYVDDRSPETSSRSSLSSGDESPERSGPKGSPTKTHSELRGSHQTSQESTQQEAALTKRQIKRRRRHARKLEEAVVNTETKIAIRGQLQEENERLKQQMYCRVCMDAPVSALLLPCKHTVLCWSCSQRLDDCPVCRARIINKITIYLSGF